MAEKTYVMTLAEKEKLEDILKNRGWREAVVKPVIGQSGRGVAKIRAGEVSLKAEDYPQGVIVQPYIREIETAGGDTPGVLWGGRRGGRKPILLLSTLRMWWRKNWLSSLTSFLEN